MKILFATAELAPFVKVGGLADASAGLVKALRATGVEVDVALPDYGELALDTESMLPLAVPDWVGRAKARRGSLDGFNSVILVETPDSRRRHPYLDADGAGWPDNDHRFFSFSAAVASLVAETSPDVLHLNDWHTGLALGFLAEPPPSLLAIHNLAYQGTTHGRWLDSIPVHSEAYEWYGGTNPLTGAIALADRVVTVSPTFAKEALLVETGFGLHEALAAKGDRFTGILNGIDTEVWDPSTDPHLPSRYGPETVTRKRRLGRLLAGEVGLDPGPGPIIGMVTRLTGQKGVDLALAAVPVLADIGARMVMLGSGDRGLADQAKSLAGESGGGFVFRSGYDEGLAHRIFAGSDLYLMPSRFEPGGLTQMQAMRYGTIPVVTGVGGLRDTVIDADAHPEVGNGFVASAPTVGAVGKALERAVSAWRSTRRRGALRQRGMAQDWSWRGPADRYVALYEELKSARR